MNAVCHRCGGEKSGPFVPCKACGYTPQGESRNVAWLFSVHHLDATELTEAADRIREGEQPDVSRALHEHARQSMGAVPLPDGALTPLPARSIVALSAANVLLTPLAGFAVWFGLRHDRPTAARQALMVTLPISVAITLLWLGVMLGRWWV